MSVLAPATTHVFNPVLRLVASRLPGFGIVTHTGRSTGRTYRTPLLVLARDDGYLVALWYGSSSQWVRNVLAEGRCKLRMRGADIELTDPKLFSDPSRRLLPLPLRLAGRAVGLTEFVRLRPGRSAP